VLGPEVAAGEQSLGADDGQRDVVVDPAASAAVSRLPVAVVKKSHAGPSSKDGALETSTTTCAPVSASVRPPPVRVLTPVFGDAAIAWCPCSFSSVTTFEPMSPVPPITTNFMMYLR